MPRPWEHYCLLTTGEDTKEQTRALLCDEKYNFKNQFAFQENKINLLEYGFLQGLYTGKDHLAVKSNGCKPAVIRILN